MLCCALQVAPGDGAVDVGSSSDSDSDRDLDDMIGVAAPAQVKITDFPTPMLSAIALAPSVTNAAIPAVPPPLQPLSAAPPVTDSMPSGGSSVVSLGRRDSIDSAFDGSDIEVPSDYNTDDYGDLDFFRPPGAATSLPTPGLAHGV